MPTGGAFVENEASVCYSNAARSWKDGINTCMIAAGCAACILRGRENILKRLVVHSGAANLGLLMRTLFGKGTPRGLAAARPAIISVAEASSLLWSVPTTLIKTIGQLVGSIRSASITFRHGVKTACFTSCC
jgi:hypothetical protein